jgi:hypothetical protein
MRAFTSTPFAVSAGLLALDWLVQGYGYESLHVRHE